MLSQRERLERLIPIAGYFALLLFLDIEADQGCADGDSAEKHECKNAAGHCGSAVIFLWRWLHICGNAEALLALFTIVLTLVTAGLWFHTRAIAVDAREESGKQARLSRKSLAISRLATRAAKTSADAAAQSVAIAEKTYITAHRPRLVIRQVHLNTRQLNLDVAPMSVSYEIANAGDTPAIVTKRVTAAKIEVIGHMPVWPNYADCTVMEAADEVDAAAIFINHTGTVEDAEEFFVARRLAQSNDPPPMEVFFFGYIVYTDLLKRERRTGFIHQYNFATEKFEPTPGESYGSYKFHD